MKLYLFPFVIILSLLFTACTDDDESWVMTYVEIKNINNEKDEPFASNDSIRKEAYAMDILYIGKLLEDGTDYSRIDLTNCKDTITDQRIISVNDFDDLHPAGSDVTIYFKPIYGSVANTDGDFHGGTFILSRIPTAGVHSFKVYIYKSNGTVIENRTESVILY